MTAPIEIRVERAGTATSVSVSGEVDLATADRLKAALDSALDGGGVLVDLESCTFIDSVGLSILVAAAHRARAAGEIVGIVSPSAPVRRLFELTQLDSLIPVFDSQADAAASLTPTEATAE